MNEFKVAVYERHNGAVVVRYNRANENGLKGSIFLGFTRKNESIYLFDSVGWIIVAVK